MSSKWSKGTSGPAGDEVANLIAHAVAPPITHNPYGDHESRDGLLVAAAWPLTSGMAASASRMPQEQGALVPVAIQERAVSENPAAGPDGTGVRQDGAAYTLEARTVPQAVAFRTAGDGAVYDEGDVTAPLTTGTDQNAQIIAQRWRVRRLTPRECERLQGFPDDFTRIPYRGKRADLCPDGPRYKALGNSMAVNVMEWIGERIAEVDAL
jgi:DNA (cytosine-5)-methyltransferase 1